MLAIWSALLGRIGELVLRRFARLILHEPVFVHPFGFWLGPLSALLLFTPLILLAWALGRIGGAASAWFSAVWVATWLACFNASLLIPRVHLVALALLAAGVATQVAWLAHRRPPQFQWVVFRSSVALVVIALVAGPLASRRTLPAPGPEGGARRGAPSVILLVLDTVRALELSAYGYLRPTTPRMAALADKGVRFQYAVATAPWTLPTHASLFTGLYQHEAGVGWTTPLPSGPLTLAEYFTAAGYATGGFTSNLRYTSRDYRLDRGFEEYRDYAWVPSLTLGMTMLGRLLISVYNDATGHYVMPGRKPAALVVDEFREWRAEVGERPYFAFLNLFDAHDPYVPEAPFDRMFGDGEPITRRVEIGRPHSALEVQGLQDAYDGAIAYLDGQVGRLIDELREDGTLDQTLIIVTADHGEEFAEHGWIGHGSGLHLPAIHVPLIVSWPGGGIPGGVAVEAPVSLVDLPATVVDLAAPGEDNPFPGTSLASLWQGNPAAERSAVLSELYWAPNQPEGYPVAGGNLRSLVRGRFHVIVGPGEQVELYDVVADPFEQVDLARRPELADTLRALRAELARFPFPDRGGR